MIHQPPDWDSKFGYSEILKEQLYIGGEDDIDELLYGTIESRNLNGKGSFFESPMPQIDTWIDLRDHRPNNRKIYIPTEVEYFSLPFADGSYIEAEQILPKAKEVLTNKLNNGNRVLVTCHQGRSRSALLVLWYLAETLGSYSEAFKVLKDKRYIIKPDRNFSPFLEEWKRIYL
ncbi:hypothetical protein EDM56_10560 [Brevibacillus fluminis]|uniref:Tyrosine specific protein phosphatases domain-containing protein n=1 Tax=Brevibacillus fluminis TaxID=511487 RepID=A0A3M8DNG7_9BACL|nr:dual specificity protein phosphatase [Brevibacillus fluminis]RNB89618.1 hypothetical protein EDM56_10560 [Brevibacillus fluminis]